MNNRIQQMERSLQNLQQAAFNSLELINSLRQEIRQQQFRISQLVLSLVTELELVQQEDLNTVPEDYPTTLIETPDIECLETIPAFLYCCSCGIIVTDVKRSDLRTPTIDSSKAICGRCFIV